MSGSRFNILVPSTFGGSVDIDRLENMQEEELRQLSDLIIQWKNMIEIRKCCDLFKKWIKWVSDVDSMINLYTDLKKKWLIIEKRTDVWIIFDINWLDYEIYKLNPLKLDDADFIKKDFFYKKWLRIEVQKRVNKTNFMQDETFEISRKDLENLSWRLWQWWKVPTDDDFKLILETLWKKYSEVIKYPANIDNTMWDKYSECGAFFMLISKIYWIILLQNGVYKLFDVYRWFRDWELDGLWNKLNFFRFFLYI